MAVQFNLNSQKALEAIVYLANKKPDMTQYYFMKMMFYADKFHLNEFGLPIIGDKYIKMKDGPVPSFVLDAIHLDGSKLMHDDYERINESLSFRKSRQLIYTTAKRKADLNLLSKTNIKCLDRAFTFCKDKDFSKLRSLTHKEPAWEEAKMNRDMDYFLFIDKRNPNREALKADLSDDFGTLVL